MATQTPNAITFDFAKLQEQVVAQVKNLDFQDPASWPVFHRSILFVLTAVGVLTMLWFLWLSSSQEDLQRYKDVEVKLRADYQVKLAKAVNLDALKQQREQVQEYVILLEKQLPSKAEMDALLSDINQAGLGRSLQFDLFRPGQVVIKEYYAELPIAIKVTGRYHDIGAFASDIAHLSRIVTLSNLVIGPKNDGTLLLESTAKTYRYLDSDELPSQRETAKGGKK